MATTLEMLHSQPVALPGRIDNLIMKVAERCNLRCSDCYMYEHEDKSYFDVLSLWTSQFSRTYCSARGNIVSVDRITKCP